MGGEYLPDSDADEVEIGRVDLESTTHHVISLRARPAVGGIAYRVLDEYESQYHIALRFSEQPLTLRQLIRLLDRADSPELGGMTMGILEMNHENGATAEELLDFLAVSSEYYLDLRKHYWFRVRDWLRQHRACAGKRGASSPRLVLRAGNLLRTEVGWTCAAMAEELDPPIEPQRGRLII